MKLSSISAFVVLCACASEMSAAWYAGTSAGIQLDESNVMAAVKVAYTFEPATPKSTSSALELELVYLPGGDDEESEGFWESDEDDDRVPLLLNYRWTADVGDAVIFYAGGGLGASFTSVSSSSVKIAYQGFAGLGYEINEKATLRGGYRYVALGDGDGSYSCIELGVDFAL